MMDTAFLQPEEQELARRFTDEGFVTAPAVNSEYPFTLDLRRAGGLTTVTSQ